MQKMGRESPQIFGAKKGNLQHKERTEFYENLPIVPIFKLNSFINEIDRDSIRDI
jgi:hypothetical protein